VQARIRQATSGQRRLGGDDLQLRRLFPRLDTANLAFRNDGALRFIECGAAWGFDQTSISQGACLADLDNDGDLDVILNNLNGSAGVYRNNASASRIAVRLSGRAPNTAGIGARIEVSGGPVRQSQEIVCGGHYVSSDQAQRTFAAGAARALTVRIRWRNGRESVLPNVPPNCLVDVLEPAAIAFGSPAEYNAMPPVTSATDSALSGSTFRFADMSDVLGHVHEDQPFNDFDRQPLLPRKLSQLGPGVAWWDFDADGRDDLFLGSGRGGRIALFLNSDGGRFHRQAGPPLDRPLEGDSAGLAGWLPGRLFVAFANYEEHRSDRPGVVEWNPAGAVTALPLAEACFGSLAVADYDANGELDLFVGARVLGGRYPAPATSSLYRRVLGTLNKDDENQRRLPAALVSSAIWSDLTNDGWPELILACEWGPLRIFRNDRGRLHPWNPSISWADTTPPRSDLETLESLTGWWNGVAAGDLDNDGRLDILAANWGRNTRYERWRLKPLRIDYGDFNGDGFIELLENHYVPELSAYAPDRMLDSVSRVLPQLNERFLSHAMWANAGIGAILGEWSSTAHRVEAVWLESTLLLNRGESFEVHVLPAEAQFTPAFAVCIGDANGDGNEDVFLSQNFFGVNADDSRSDAGRGLWLRGDGQGHLTAVPGHESGVEVYGEQRGAALADYDGDNRVDLAVSQNRAETKLYRNVGAVPGLRVQLEGSPGNPYGIGAVVRLHYGPNRAGPAREVRAGNGFWSQDSPVVVLGTPTPATEVEVRWPGGRLTRSRLASGTRTVRIVEQ
jgi:hypothetical protein